MSMEVRTTCPYCGTGCGVIAKAGTAADWLIDGDPQHPANFGKLCTKGSTLAATLGLEGRLLYPEIHRRRASWDEALDLITGRFAEIAALHGPDAIAFYLSGQLLTEDYYVANKLAKGFIGTPHVDTNSRLCMASSVAGHKRAFGADTVPACYEDLDVADLLVLAGSNAAWNHPILFQRMLANKRERGAKIVAIDVRATATTRQADLVLLIKPGSDAWLFNGLLCHLASNGALDRQYIAQHTSGLDAALKAALAAAPDARAVARQTGLTVAVVRRFYELFSATRRVVTCYSQGINQSTSGSDKVNAILNCHLATGRIGTPGSGPLSLTGQPNAMGGREVGGLANQLAAHMDFDAASIDRVRRFWRAPNLVTREGLKAVEMFEAVRQGRIKAIWILCTNPVVSLPDASHVREALQRCELVIVSDCVTDTDTLAYADVALPATSWGEKEGTVTNSERRISRQRAFLPAPGEARADWWALAEVGRRLGFKSGFPYQDPAEIFREHARLSAFENDGARDFNLSGLADLDDAAYDALEPVQWPVRAGSSAGTDRLFAEGRFFTADRKARFVAVTPLNPAQETAEEFPLRLNTGRVRDQWHTMTRTGRAPELAEPWREPFLEVSPADATRYGLQNGGLARASSPLGHIVLRVQVCEGQPEGQVFAPIHWSQSNASDGSVNTLIAPLLDRISGQPESKATPVAVAPVSVVCSGLVVSRRPVTPNGAVYWSRSRSEDHYLHVVAFAERPAAGWSAWAEQLLGAPARTFMRFEDEGEDVFRAALIEGGSIVALILVEPGPQGIDLDAVAGSLAEKDPVAHEWAKRLLVPAGDGFECARGAP